MQIYMCIYIYMHIYNTHTLIQTPKDIQLETMAESQKTEIEGKKIQIKTEKNISLC